jgi:hypothetical protein
MYGIVSSQQAVSQGTAEILEYTPPSGSTLVGGTMSVGMYADGYGGNARAVVALYEPEDIYNGNVFFQCVALSNACGGSDNFTGEVALRPDRGGNLYLGAECGGESGQVCYQGSLYEAWALVEVGWADLALANSSSPAASNFEGTLLQPDVSGTAELGFTTTDSGGPGVYLVTAQVDGKNLYSGTPDTNGGRCVAVGTRGEAVMFDYQQPCKQTETVDIPVNTASLPDGSNTLKVLVTDAANNTSTVYDTNITTENAPTVIAAPSVSGSAQVGSTLNGTPGVFQARTGLEPLSSVTSQWLRCSGSGTGCAPIAGATSSTYTPVAGDKGYTIEYKNSVEDAAKHKQSAVSAPTVAVAEAPGSEASCAGDTGCQSSGGNGGNGGSGGSGGPGSGSTSTTTNNTTNNSSSSEVLSSEALAIARGAANGTPASDQASLSVHWAAAAHAASVKIGYTHRTRAEGRLVASDGQPIAGAVLQVIATPSSPGTSSYSEGTVKTAGDGSFVFDTNVKRSSRTLTFEYKSHANDVSLAAQAQLSVGVPVPVSLKIAPHTVRRGSTIRMSGSVPGPIPSGGKQIVLQALAVGVHGAKWQTFNVVRTNSKGKFKASYRFRFAGPASYRIRATSRYEQDYPYLASTSSTTLIREH